MLHSNECDPGEKYYFVSQHKQMGKNEKKLLNNS